MINKKQKKKIYKIILIFILSAFVFYFASQIICKYKNRIILSYPDFSFLKKYPTNKASLDGIVSKNYIVYDADNNTTIIGKNEKEMKPLASITKVMTALIAMENCQDYFTVDGKSREKKEIIKYMLVTSSNEIAEKIAANCPNTEDFVYMMNSYAKKNNLNLSYLNPSGLDINDETEPSALGSAESVAKLLLLAEKSISDELDSTTENSFDGKHNTNTFVNQWPFLVASKTGFTDTAGGNLATIFDPYPGKRIVIVVLGSTVDARFTDTEKLLEYFIKNK